MDNLTWKQWQRRLRLAKKVAWTAAALYEDSTKRFLGRSLTRADALHIAAGDEVRRGNWEFYLSETKRSLVLVNPDRGLRFTRGLREPPPQAFYDW